MQPEKAGCLTEQLAFFMCGARAEWHNRYALPLLVRTVSMHDAGAAFKVALRCTERVRRRRGEAQTLVHGMCQRPVRRLYKRTSHEACFNG
jgi:hypothetical protein